MDQEKMDALLERKKEFDEAVKPLHAWICKYGNPYTAVIVQLDGAQAYEGFVAAALEVPD